MGKKTASGGLGLEILDRLIEVHGAREEELNMVAHLLGAINETLPSGLLELLVEPIQALVDSELDSKLDALTIAVNALVLAHREQESDAPVRVDLVITTPPEIGGERTRLLTP